VHGKFFPGEAKQLFRAQGILPGRVFLLGGRAGSRWTAIERTAPAPAWIASGEAALALHGLCIILSVALTEAPHKRAKLAPAHAGRYRLTLSWSFLPRSPSALTVVAQSGFSLRNLVTGNSKDIGQRLHDQRRTISVCAHLRALGGAIQKKNKNANGAGGGRQATV